MFIGFIVLPLLQLILALPLYTNNFHQDISSTTVKLWFLYHLRDAAEKHLNRDVITSQLTCHSRLSGLPIDLIHLLSEYQSVCGKEVELHWFQLINMNSNYNLQCSLLCPPGKIHIHAIMRWQSPRITYTHLVKTDQIYLATDIYSLRADAKNSDAFQASLGIHYSNCQSSW